MTVEPSSRRVQKVRRFYEEAYTDGDYAVIDELFHPDFSGNGSPPGSSPLGGPEIVRRSTDRIRTAFPDFHPAVRAIYVDGDTVIAHLDVTATHEGPLVFGSDDPPFVVEPTGRPVAWEGLRIYRFDGDQVVESWAWAPWVGILLQIGAAGAYERHLAELSEGASS